MGQPKPMSQTCLQGSRSFELTLKRSAPDVVSDLFSKTHCRRLQLNRLPSFDDLKLEAPLVEIKTGKGYFQSREVLHSLGVSRLYRSIGIPL